MAYLGVRESAIGRTIEVRLHGPYHTRYGFDKLEFKACVGVLVEQDTGLDPNVTCKNIAQKIIDMFGDDENFTWAECEIQTSDGFSYGVAAVPQGTSDE